MPSAAAYDPGGIADNFGMLTSELTSQEILLTDAITWNKTKTPNFTYDFVMQKIAHFNSVFKFDYHLCESNNTGVPVIHGLRTQYGINVTGINTSNNLRIPKTIRAGQTLDKNKTVEWVNLLRERKVIKFPAKMTPGLYELQGELDNFGTKKLRGRTTYGALTGHDDIVSCLITTVHFAKLRFLKFDSVKPFTFFDSDLQGDIITVLNKEFEEGKTGLHWTRVT